MIIKAHVAAFHTTPSLCSPLNTRPKVIASEQHCCWCWCPPVAFMAWPGSGGASRQRLQWSHALIVSSCSEWVRRTSTSQTKTTAAKSSNFSSAPHLSNESTLGRQMDSLSATPTNCRLPISITAAKKTQFFRKKKEAECFLRMLVLCLPVSSRDHVSLAKPSSALCTSSVSK